MILITSYFKLDMKYIKSYDYLFIMFNFLGELYGV